MRAGSFSVYPFVFPLLMLFLGLSIFSGCRRNADEVPVMPPATHPLAGEYIGFAVVNVSFVHLLSEAGQTGISQGYLRRGAVVRIIERRPVLNRGNTESWVLAEGNYQGQGSLLRGWLEESSVEVFSSEARANTASKAMNL